MHRNTACSSKIQQEPKCPLRKSYSQSILWFWILKTYQCIFNTRIPYILLSFLCISIFKCMHTSSNTRAHMYRRFAKILPVVLFSSTRIFLFSIFSLMGCYFRSRTIQTLKRSFQRLICETAFEDCPLLGGGLWAACSCHSPRFSFLP